MSQHLEVYNCLVLGVNQVLQVFFHCLLHLLEDTNDLTTLRYIALSVSLGKERRQNITIHRAHVHVNSQSPQDCSTRSLKKTTISTFFKRGYGPTERQDVGSIICLQFF